jgi:hypothetical protein
MALKVTKWAHYFPDEEEREGKREIMRMKKTKMVMDRNREIAGLKRHRENKACIHDLL